VNENTKTGASLEMRRERMRIEGTYMFEASAERVFAALLDPDVLRQVIPGCERLIQFGPADEDGAYGFEARVRPGAESGVYTTSGAVERARKPSHLALSLHAQGPAGAVPLRGTLDLVAQDGRTVAAYAWDVDLRGVPDARDEDLRPAAERYAREICERVAARLRADRPERNGLAEALPLLRADSARGKIVLLPPEPPETLASRLSPASRAAIWTAAGLAAGLAGFAVAASIVRRWGRGAGG
jgi:carbon monoxide dehydrogenase subunit G